MAVDIGLERNGIRMKAPIGFSWTTFFFGPLVPLFRGDFIWFLILFILTVPTFSIINFIFALLYNKTYVNKLIAQGWVPADEYSARLLREHNILY